MTHTQRHVIWWSAGAASSIAALLHLRDHPDSVVAYCDTRSEHPDNTRFLGDIERWLRMQTSWRYRHIEVLASTEYHDIWDVWDRKRFIIGEGGTPCTVELKKRLRQAFEDPDDVQVFGYHIGEQRRVDNFRAANPDVNLVTPLIDAGLTKSDCLAIIQRAGIELPAMYRLGYRNANCVGCPHGGMGYWNMIRRDFPDTFDRMAALERRLDHACCRPGGVPVFLNELDPERGDIYTEPEMDCSLLCVLAEGA